MGYRPAGFDQKKCFISWLCLLNSALFQSKNVMIKNMALILESVVGTRGSQGCEKEGCTKRLKTLASA
jgi:hypothetical protein